MLRKIQAEETEPQRPSLGWVFLSALGLAQICSWGSLYYAFPQIAIAMNAEFGWAKSDLYGALTLSLLLKAFAAVPIGMAIDRGYGRAVMTLGSAIAGLMFFMWSQTQFLWWFYVSLAGIGLMQAAVLYSAIFAIMSRHYDQTKVRDNITTLTLWGGFASTVFIPLIEFLMAHMDWRSVLIILGLVNILICAGIYQFLPNFTQRVPTPAHQTKLSNSDDRGTKWAIAQPVFWTLLICFALYSMMTTSFRFHLYPLLLENGLTGEKAVFIMALLGPAQVAGRALMQIYKTKSIAQIGLFVVSLFPLCFIALVLFPAHIPILMIVAVCYGTAAGTMTIIRGIAVPEFLTKNAYGTINGIMSIPITVMTALAPSIAALSWRMTGSYSVLMYGLIGLSSLVFLSFIATIVSASRSTFPDDTQHG
ncbi:MAG: MFS transporter [Hellea sp.]